MIGRMWSHKLFSLLLVLSLSWTAIPKPVAQTVESAFDAEKPQARKPAPPRTPAFGEKNIATTPAAQQAEQPGDKLFQTAQADWDNQQWEQAVAKYRRFVEQFPLHPSAAEAHFKIGYHLSYVASPEEAIAQYEQAIALAPGTHEAHESKIGIAALKYYLGEYEEARELFRQVILETDDWSLIKECTFRMKEMSRLIELSKLPSERSGMDCGPKALEIVFAKQGVRASEETLKKLAAEKGGATLEQLKEAAQAKGLKAWGVKLRVDQLNAVQKPFIAYTGNNHYIVVTNTANERVAYIDPHRGESYRTKEKFRMIWYALVFANAVPSEMRAQLLSKAEMERIRGGHHLHGINLGDLLENIASAFFQALHLCIRGFG